MKKLIGLLALAALPMLAHAGIWDSIATAGFPDKKPDAHYKLDVYGFDTRVYEFRSVTDKNVLCIAAFSGGNSNAFQMQCVNTAGGVKK